MLDVSGGIAANGSNVQQYDANNTFAQKWKFVKNGYDSQGNIKFNIVSVLNDNITLDISNGAFVNGANIQVYTCNGTAAQDFILYQK